MPGHPLKACLIAFCLLTGFGQEVSAKDSLRLYYLALPGLLERQQDTISGPLAKVLTEVSSRSGIEFHLKYMLMNRMIRELQDDTPVAGVPQLGQMIRHRYKKPVQLSVPIVFRRDYAFVRQSTTIPKSISDIKKRVLVVSPMTTLPPPLMKVEADLTILQTPSDASALIALSKGRADVWVNDETTTQAAINESNVNNIKYDVDKPFYVWPAHIVYSSAVDAYLIKRIDAAILSMVEDGTMAALLPHNFVSHYEAYLSE